MKYIVNHMIPLTGLARKQATEVGAVVVDTEGAFTTVSHFLCGDNPWGFHQDLRFGMPAGNVRQGVRIVAAAEQCLFESESVLALSDEDYEVLLSTIAKPMRHPKESPMPAELARAILPIIDAIESAQDAPGNKATEPAPAPMSFS